MKVAVLVSDFPSVSETFVLSEIAGLVQRGHEVDVYAERRGEPSHVHADVEQGDLLRRTFYEEMPHSRALRLWRSPRLMLAARDRQSFAARLRALNVFKYGAQAASLRLLYAASRSSHARAYDIIHCHFGANGLKGALARDVGALQGKLVTTFHGYDLSTYTTEHGTSVYRTLFRQGDLFLPVSERFRARLVEMNCPTEKIVTHRMGVNLDEFAFREPRAPDGRIRLVSVARLVEKKGLEYAVRAVAQLAGEGREIEYTVVGDGALREKLRRLIEETGAGAFVRLVGWKSRVEVRAMLRDAHVFVASSVTGADGDEEGIPVSLMEAMAVGLPVVATAHGGIPELVRDGATGFLVPERDERALAEKLKQVIDSPRLWAETARRARAFVEERHDDAKLHDELVRIYERLLERRR